MKKTLSLLLALLLFLGTLPIGAQAADAANSIDLGVTQTLGFVEFSVKKAELYKKIKLGSYFREASEGKKYLYLSGSIKNTFNSSYSANYIIGEFVINEKYTFALNVDCAQGNSYSDELDPFAKGTLYLYCEIPDELAAEVTSAVVRFGFNENFATRPQSLSKANYSYEITLSTDENAPNRLTIRTFSPTKYKLKTTLKGKSLKITLSKKAVKKTVKIKYKYKRWTFNREYGGESGKTVIALIGKVSNTGSSELDLRIPGYVMVGKNKYKLECSSVENWSNLPAKTKDSLIIYAEVPNSVVKKNSTAKIYFGFDDKFNSSYDAEVEDCKYNYVYTVKLS